MKYCIPTIIVVTLLLYRKNSLAVPIISLYCEGIGDGRQGGHFIHEEMSEVCIDRRS